ncbi:hypothetical protein XH90_13165 [Bradyrhizobium sp. CCBAU 53338]|nr:hypothetical protein XH90_13165 [Bradyrhizobium sp. CCBAU 53338]
MTPRLAETCCDLGDRSEGLLAAAGLQAGGPAAEDRPLCLTRPDDGTLRARLGELASQRCRFGYRRVGLLLARQGGRINRKKLYRLYKEERLTGA